jgi:hypothetical protein
VLVEVAFDVRLLAVFLSRQTTTPREDVLDSHPFFMMNMTLSEAATESHDLTAQKRKKKKVSQHCRAISQPGCKYDTYYLAAIGRISAAMLLIESTTWAAIQSPPAPAPGSSAGRYLPRTLYPQLRTGAIQRLKYSIHDLLVLPNPVPRPTGSSDKPPPSKRGTTAGEPHAGQDLRSVRLLQLFALAAAVDVPSATTTSTDMAIRQVEVLILRARPDA